MCNIISGVTVALSYCHSHHSHVFSGTIVRVAPSHSRYMIATRRVSSTFYLYIDSQFGALEPWNFMTFYSVGKFIKFIIPTDELHHFSGVGIPPTRQVYINIDYINHILTRQPLKTSRTLPCHRLARVKWLNCALRRRRVFDLKRLRNDQNWRDKMGIS